MTDYYTCSHGNYALDCIECDIEREDRIAEQERRKASKEVRWFAVTSLGRFRLNSACHETDAITKAASQPGELKRVIKETRETIWEAQ